MNHAAHLPKKVLIVEDYPAIARLLADVFAASGIDAEIIGNGVEAIVCLKDDAADYGLVCSDVELPGASGWTVLEWVHTHHPDLPIMLLSGTDDANFVRDADQRGAVAALRKPFSIHEIERTLTGVFPDRENLRPHISRSPRFCRLDPTRLFKRRP